jgi:hypothetical protein
MSGPSHVIPVKAVIQSFFLAGFATRVWTPACAGVTKEA